MGIDIKLYPQGPLSENTYLITDESSGLKAVIDPGYIGNDILNDIKDKDTLKYIILTHAHFDHFYSAEEYIKIFPDAEFIAPKADEYLLKKPLGKDYAIYGAGDMTCPTADVLVGESDKLMLGESELSFIETPGHTEGSMCVLCDDNLFSGDTLFRLSVGTSSLETGSWEDLKNSISSKLYVLDENTKVFPGHGGATTIAYEKRSNPFV